MANKSYSEKQSPYAKYIRSQAGLYDEPNQPVEKQRQDLAAPAKEQSHMIAQRPAWPIYALPTPFFFQNADNVNTTNTWKQTASGSGTVLTVQDERGGVAKFTNGAADNNYYFYESLYEIGRLQAGKRLFMRGRFKIGDVDQADMFFGLCSRLASGNLFDNRVDAIGVYLVDASAALAGEARKDGSATAGTGMKTISDDTWVTVGINVEGTTRVRIFIDNPGTCQATIESNLPDDEEMCFSFGCRNGQAAANTMSVGFTLILQDE